MVRVRRGFGALGFECVGEFLFVVRGVRFDRVVGGVDAVDDVQSGVELSGERDRVRQCGMYPGVCVDSDDQFAARRVWTCRSVDVDRLECSPCAVTATVLVVGHVIGRC